MTAANRTDLAPGEAESAACSSILRLDAELTIYGAPDTKEALLSALEASVALTLDGSAVSEIDTTGLQLLILLEREAARAGKRVELTTPSAALGEALALCSLGGLFAGGRVGPGGAA